jgi:small subunit ribosomal protein S19e
MTTVYDIPAEILIKHIAVKLKEEKIVEPPKWALYVKTGIHKELSPVNDDWWYTRCASTIRRIYIGGPVGVSRLKSFYGGKHRRGAKPAVHAKGSGSIIRTALHQLEKAGLVNTIKKGRVISGKGQAFLDNTAHEAKSELLKQYPGLEKY